MRLFFLGTAAAEGYPGIFCNCKFCQEARLLGGRNLRYRSALLINDDLLIDFGPDLLASALRFNLNLWRVTAGLVTHAHLDHFFAGNFEMRRAPFTGEQDIPTLRLFGSREISKILAQVHPDLAEMRLEFQAVGAFDTWINGGYTFTAFRAYHAVGELEALFYSVDDGQHAILYATDTGAFPTDTWQALTGRSFDVIILEETLGDGHYDQHLGFATFLEHVERMRGAGMLRPGGRVIAHHLSHSGNPSHEKLEAYFSPYAVEVAYDGLEIMLVDKP
jgi:phosphoribosyl 1,2-cyclic phosphate phosphodiesterase